MTLPAGTWDYGTFDADVDTVFANPPWSMYPDPVGSIVSPGVWEFDISTYAQVQLSPPGNIITVAFSVKVDGVGGTSSLAVQAFVGTHWAAIVGLAVDGLYITLDGGVSFIKAVDVVLSDTFHVVFCIWDNLSETCVVNLDGTDVLTLSSGAGLVDIFSDLDSLIFANIPGYHSQFKFIAVASTSITPPSAGPSAVADFHVGATGVTFKIDEYANYPAGLTDAQILIHYKAAKGIGV